mgnify:FL=1|tara:strand:- start:38 stop:220 length:183 start_codon:yes stop_codon:yes gene_type:complete
MTINLELKLDLNQFRELKYLIETQLDKESNLIKFNEDEELIESLKDIREQLRYPIIKENE